MLHPSTGTLGVLLPGLGHKVRIEYCPPRVCRINLPMDAQKVYRDAFNRAWTLHADENGERHRLAQSHAWNMVRARFERDQFSGRWMPRKSQ